MPNPKPGGAPGSIFGSLLDEMLGSGAKQIGEVARRFVPKCEFCGTMTPGRCAACGRFVCNVHSFINAQAWDRFNIICAECVSHHFPFVQVEPPRTAHPGGEDDWSYEEPPWEILGVSWHSTEEEIKAAYRSAAKQTHPDRATDEVDRRRREKATRRLTAAYDYMMRKSRGGQ